MMTSTPQENRPTFLPLRLLTWAALLAILLGGGYFRYVGQNWDDFTGLHPDERFLTQNLLPNVGGLAEYTPDDKRFPPQNLYVAAGEVVLRDRVDIATRGVMVGAVRGGKSADVVRWWLGDERVREFDNANQAMLALNEGQVGALMFDDASFTVAGFDSTASFLRQVGRIEGVEIQTYRCNYQAQHGGISYWDALCNPLNPHNSSVGYYAYGTLPLFMAHIGLQITRTEMDNPQTLFPYAGEAVVWRSISAFFDVGAILLVFLVAQRLHGNWAGLLAALLYACAPLAIQKAHYGTVNSVTGFFVMLALWAAVRVQQGGGWRDYLTFGVAMGAALAGRINVAPLALLIGLAALLHGRAFFDLRLPKTERYPLLWRGVGGVALAAAVTIVVFRIANPYAFLGQGGGILGFFDVRPNPRFLDDLATSSFGVSGNMDTPPNWQWVGRASYLYPYTNFLLWGFGLAPAILATWGVLWGIWRIAKGRANALLNALPLAWVAGYYLYIGNLWVMTMRYYLPLYGAAAILAAWALVELWRHARYSEARMAATRLLLLIGAGFLLAVPAAEWASGLSSTGIVAGAVGLILGLGALWPGLRQTRVALLGGFTALFAVVWALMFTNIYSHQLTRVQAARWMLENVPSDFALPLEGAPAGTPLINIALPNTPTGASITNSDLLAQAGAFLPERTPITQSFTAPASGMLSEVLVPRLGDADQDSNAETLYLSIGRRDAEGQVTLLSETTFTRDLDDANAGAGARYTIPLPMPIPIEQGQDYVFKAEALEGNLSTWGSVILTEGDWDDRITTTMLCTLPNGLSLKDDVPSGLVGYFDCKGLQPWISHVTSYDMPMSYPVDERLKRDAIVGALHDGDYLAVTSNRFYDSESRLRMRFPFTTAYYDALFQGELGYTLVGAFDETFEWGVLRASDQHLPTYSSPLWLNELEADEAFHVYDHPAVFVFQKNADYDPVAVEAKLNNVALQRVEEIYLSGRELGADVVGVVYWSSLQADAANNALMLEPDQLAMNREGGTWSERFDRTSPLYLNQPLGVVAWWLLIVIYGWAAFPILFVIFPKLADKGYSVAKFLGMLLVSYLAWVLTGLKLPLWNQAGVLMALVAIGLFGWVMVWQQRGALITWVRQHWRLILSIEVLTALLYIAFIGVRLTNPDLWHDVKGGEKPMDFAYFNSVLRATTFPAADPWYAGGYINYYYFGFVMVGSPVLLLKLVPSFAYNLIVPTLFAITGMGAFAAAFNIVANWQERLGKRKASGGDDDAPTPDSPRQQALGSPWVAGIAALLLCCVLGNLDTLRVLVTGVAQAGGYQIPTGVENYVTRDLTRADVPVLPDQQAQLDARIRNITIFDRVGYELNNAISLTTGFFNGLGVVSRGGLLPIGTDRWYWAPTRILAETPGVEGNAITEMPYFTFLYGDLHAHMINLPMLLFVILFLYHELASARADARPQGHVVLAVLVGALSVGMIQAINTWDWPAFLLLSVLALGYAAWLRYARLNMAWGLFTLAYVGGFVVASFAASLPYTTWYAATYGALQLWQGGKTPLWAYFNVHGLLLFLVVALLLWETGRWLRSVRVGALAGQARPTLLLLGIVVAVLLVALVMALMGYQVALVVLPVVVWIAFLFFRPFQSVEMQYVLVLVGLALAMTLGVEIIVLGGDIGRQNTVFKFYMQAWVLLAVAAGCAFAWVLQASEMWWGRWRVLWYTPLTVLVVMAALYPIMATRGRSFDRMVPDLPLTLDGFDYMKTATHNLTYTYDKLNLGDDYLLIRWLQDNAVGSPVILEGRAIASEYTWTGRIAINTGLPTLLGWRFHQTQQRTFDPLGRLIDQREQNVKFFYNSADLAQSVYLLHHYDVRYVIFSGLEMSQSTPEGRDKINRLSDMGILSVAFFNEGGRIYEVNAALVEQFLYDEAAQARGISP